MDKENNISIESIMSEEGIKEVARRIISKRIPWEFEVDENGDYWLITVSPTGQVFLPDKEITGHPAMTKYEVFPQDMILYTIYVYFTGDINLDNDNLMAYYMLINGYIDGDGYLNNGNMNWLYVSEALTIYTKRLIESLKKYTFPKDLVDEDNSDEEKRLEAKKIIFFRKKLIEIIESRYRNLRINDAIRGMSADEKKDILANIESQYEKDILNPNIEEIK